MSAEVDGLSGPRAGMTGAERSLPVVGSFAKEPAPAAPEKESAVICSPPENPQNHGKIISPAK